jgi:hypothetical protein
MIKLVLGVDNSGRPVTWTMKYCNVVPNIFGSSVWNLLCISLLVSTILRWCLDFGIFVDS